LVEEGGRRHIVVYPGAKDYFACNADVSGLVQAAQSSRILHLSSFAGEDQRHPQETVVGTAQSSGLVSLTPGAICAGQSLNRNHRSALPPKALPKGEKTSIVDSTKCGTATVGFLLGMLRGAPLEQCIDSAFLMAAFVSTQLGARAAAQVLILALAR
jgi:sugar/nucleoside kinase (ribokinase family)